MVRFELYPVLGIICHTSKILGYNLKLMKYRVLLIKIKITIIFCGDDGHIVDTILVVIFWDVSNKTITVFMGHREYIRSAKQHNGFMVMAGLKLQLHLLRRPA